MKRILIIDDDTELCRMLVSYLSAENLECDCEHDGLIGADMALQQRHDLIILDVMLPGQSGLDALKSIRSESTTPIIMLTARGEEVDRIIGLELGADDYLSKPFSPRELLARIRAIERRSSPVSTTALHSGPVSLNPGQRTATLAGQPLELTSTEFNLLMELLRHAGQVVDKASLSERVMSRKLTAHDRSIDMHIAALRRKLGPDEQLIKTIRGIGYQLVN